MERIQSPLFNKNDTQCIIIIDYEKKRLDDGVWQKNSNNNNKVAAAAAATATTTHQKKRKRCRKKKNTFQEEANIYKHFCWMSQAARQSRKRR